MTNQTAFQLNKIAFQTLILKEFMRFMRIWSQTLLPPAITMSLYFIIFGKFIGSQIHKIDGYIYIQYIVPGLVMMSVMTNAYSNTVSSFFLARFNKSLEEMLVSPMANLTILLGFTFGGAIRGLLVGTIVMIISYIFTSTPMHHPLIILMMAVFVAMVFSLAGFINGVYAKRFDDISFIPTFVITPLTYLGGIFYSIHQLPAPWYFVTQLNPIFYMVDAFRYGMLGVSDVNIYLGLSIIAMLFIVMFLWAWRLLQKGNGIKL